MSNRTALKTKQAFWVVSACIAVGGACGGRAVTIEAGGPATAGADVSSGAAAGTVAAGGASGRASGGTGNASKAGSASAGSASAGSASAGAPNDCPKACPPITCDATSTLVFPNGACCAACVSSCPPQPCPGLTCPVGYEPETLAGACCPSCVAISVDCAAGQQSYSTLRFALTDKYKYGCSTAFDCIAVAPRNPCESGCSYVPIASSNLGNFSSNLAGQAQDDCASCMPVAVPLCAAPEPVTCSLGQCAFLTAR